MDKETQKKALEALERQQRQWKRQNDYIKNNYERVTVTLPKGSKDAIAQTGESVNGLINRLVADYLKRKGDK